MSERRPYSRVYLDLVDDPMFAEVYADERTFGRWVQMLMLADAMWPASAPMPSKTATVRKLVECGLVIEKPGNRYSIRGLDKERAVRSEKASNASAKRWENERTAKGMPRRDEQSKDEQGGRNATHHGQHPDCLVCAPLRKSA